MSFHFLLPSLLGIGISLGLISSAPGVVLFTSLSPSGTYDPFGGFEVRSNPLPSVTVAAAFTPSQTRRLESIDLGLRSIAPPTGGGSVLVSLFDSNSAGQPGTLLESLGTLSDFPFFGGPDRLDSRLETATSPEQPLLHVGREYFIVLTVPSSEVFSTIWNHSTEPVDLPRFRSIGAGPFETSLAPYPALRVNGVIPEPSTLTLALLAAPILLHRRRH